MSVCACVCAQEVWIALQAIEDGRMREAASADKYPWTPTGDAALDEAQVHFSPLTHRSHSIGFTRAQGIPKYKIGFGRDYT